MVKATNGDSHRHPVVDVPTSLIISIGKSAEMDGFLAKLIDDVQALQKDIKNVAKGTKFRFKLEVHSSKGEMEVYHTVDHNCNSIIRVMCEGGNGGGD